MKNLSVKPNKSQVNETCVASCIKILGNKWTALILTELSTGTKRFTELERSLTGISPRSLSQKLETLLEFRVISKKSYSEVPPRTEYTLTNKGHDFLPILEQMSTWGTKYPC